MKYIRTKQKDMPSIGNCDTCDYILQCTRGSATSTSILKEMLGCPKNLSSSILGIRRKENKK